MSISQLARKTWKRLGHWYGVNAIERKFGARAIPPDWAKAIDSVGKDRIDLVMADLKSKYPNEPCSLPEFEIIARKHRPKYQGATVRNHSRLTEYALTHLALTKRQSVGCHWKYLRDCNEIVGLEIPADGDAPGHRVMLADVDSFG